MMNARLTMLLAAFVLLPLTASADDEPPTPTPASSEWQIRNVWRIEFEGNDTFSADNIRRALAMNPATQAAVIGTVPREQFVRTVGEQVQAGFRHEGFRNAEARAVFDEQREIVQVSIAEGPRYTKEALADITGVSAPMREAIQNSLTQKRPAPTPQNPSATKSALWKAGGHSWPEGDAVSEIRAAISSELARHGYHFAEFDVRVDVDDEDHRIRLQVAFSDLGLPLRFSNVQFTGLKRHAPAQVIDDLGIGPDSVVNAELHEHIQQRLLSSARFLLAHSWNEMPFGPDHAVPLHIDVRELESVPLLNEQLSTEQQELLRCADWLNNWHEQGDDIRVSLTMDIADELASTPVSDQVPADTGSDQEGVVVRFLKSLAPDELRCDLVLSQAGGIFSTLVVRDTSGSAIIDLAVQHSTTGARIVSRRQRAVWKTNESFGHPVATIQWKGIPEDPAAEHQRTAAFALGLGFQSDAPSTPNVLFLVTPAVFLSTFATSDAQRTDGERPGSIRYSTESGSFEFDRTTGMLQRVEYTLEPYQITVSRDPSALSREVAKLDAETAEWQNRFDAEHPLSTLVAFSASEAERICEVAGIESIPTLLRVLKAADGIGRSADRALAVFEDEWFTIPSGDKGLSAGSWPFHVAMALVPPGSTAHRLASALLGGEMTGDYSALRHLAMEITFEESHGPVDCLAAAFAITSMRPQFAGLGLSRLSFQDAERDIRPLIEGRSVISDLLRGSISFVRDISDQEAELLIQAARQLHAASKQRKDRFVYPDVSPVIVMIRNAPSDDPGEITAALLPFIWAGGLEDALKTQLTAFRGETKNDNPVRTVSRQERNAKTSLKVLDQAPLPEDTGTEQESKSKIPAVDIPESVDSIFKPTRRIIGSSSQKKK